VIASHSEKAPRLAHLDPVALAAGRLVAARSDEAKNVPEQARVTVAGEGYAVGLSPLWFQGWQLAVIVPEAESLGTIDGRSCGSRSARASSFSSPARSRSWRPGVSWRRRFRRSSRI
jgi:hypothetical protein